MTNELINELSDRIGVLQSRGISPGILVECRNELTSLRDWVAKEGERNNTCTFNVIGEICKGCGCKKGRSLYPQK